MSVNKNGPLLNTFILHISSLHPKQCCKIQDESHKLFKLLGKLHVLHYSSGTRKHY